jgi:hypothetical protein
MLYAFFPRGPKLYFPSTLGLYPNPPIVDQPCLTASWQLADLDIVDRQANSSFDPNNFIYSPL